MIKKSLIPLVLGAILFFQCCDNEVVNKIPLITTVAVTNITFESAESGGEVTSDGNSTIISRGVCWNTSSAPTIDNFKSEDGVGIGAFTSALNGLTGNTKYFIRAYATNEVGTAYGEEFEFTTSLTPTLAEVTTASITNITVNSASSGGNVISDGHVSVTARGICWSTTANPDINDNKTSDGTGTGTFTSAVTNLSAGTTYYIRAYATNSVGTAYGNEILFSTNSISTTVYASKDAAIFNNQAGNAANGDYGAGGSQLLQVGYASPTQIYARSLLYFDLSSIPTTAVIESVSLQFTQGSSGSATAYSINIHKLSTSWTEGTTSFCTYNNSCNTQGAAITVGGADVTWNETSYSGSNSNPWTAIGGVFNGAISATAQAGSTNIGTPYSFTSDGLKDDVQGWVSNSATNFGWILKTDFITTTSAMKRFYSREGAVASGDSNLAPRLIITYH